MPKKPINVQTWRQEVPVCPYCGQENSVPDVCEDATETCGKCDREYRMTVEKTYCFTTEVRP